MGSLAILSGPAGGVVGYAETTFDKTKKVPVIGFDMGGNCKGCMAAVISALCSFFRGKKCVISQMNTSFSIIYRNTRHHS